MPKPTWSATRRMPSPKLRLGSTRTPFYIRTRIKNLKCSYSQKWHRQAWLCHRQRDLWQNLTQITPNWTSNCRRSAPNREPREQLLREEVKYEQPPHEWTWKANLMEDSLKEQSEHWLLKKQWWMNTMNNFIYSFKNNLNFTHSYFSIQKQLL